MKVFISWSGESSKKLAEAIHNWLPSVLQLVKPYFTPSDVEKGARWNSEIAKELESCEVGILCITRDNLHSDWVLFEAGALSKSLDRAHVCPVLFGIHNTDLAGPLKQFQTTEYEKKDFRKLVSVINGKLGENKLSAKVVDSVFEKWWPELQERVNEVLEGPGEGDGEPVRQDRELIVEILELSRDIAQKIRKTPRPVSTSALVDLLTKYISLHNEQVHGEGGYQQTLDDLEAMKKAITYIARSSRKSPELNELLEELQTLTFKYEKSEDNSPSEDEEVPF